ncbi:unnamed protein product [Adineta steineri]|uniref:Glycosyltransferase 2-like domain-containing protein n=1 Tax=Adineta steineri TaxID=433720 RepID=A0A815TW51_9BILA|nr:unnamed protein product [Adineta steineri]CAF4127437.1 unnamed protein product [Adineta steineri]
MATYQRSNQKSPYYLKRSVRSVLAQEYSEWELFVTGDKYVNETEFKYIFRNVPANKLFLHNLEKPGERDKLSGINLWYCVGATAMNNALDRAEEKYRDSEKYRDNKLIIAHLDDDDTWHPSHLQNLVNAYNRFPSVSFVWSKGYYCASGRGDVYPLINVSNTINNKPPTIGLTLHSSVSWKMRTFHSFRYRRIWEYRDETPTVGDGDLWTRMTKFMLKKNINFYHSLAPTVEHLQERQSKPCTKANNQSSWYPDDNSFRD